jgi:hypothetical protein
MPEASIYAPEFLTRMAPAAAYQVMHAREAYLQTARHSFLLALMMASGASINVEGPSKKEGFFTEPTVTGRWIGSRLGGVELPDAGRDTPFYEGFLTNRYLVIPTGTDEMEMMELEGAPGKLFDYVGQRAHASAWSLQRLHQTALWTGNGIEEPSGISTFIEAAPFGSQTATHMGISKSAHPWWQNQSVRLTRNFGYIAPGTSQPAGILAIKELIRATSFGARRPSILVTTEAIFQNVKRYYDEITLRVESVTSIVAANLGFETVMVEGVEIGWDIDCPADRVYALHIVPNLKARSWVFNNKGDEILDKSFEKAGGESFIKVDANMAMVNNPRIRMRPLTHKGIDARRQSTVSWMVDSMNYATRTLGAQGVLYSDNGTRLSTW